MFQEKHQKTFWPFTLYFAMFGHVFGGLRGLKIRGCTDADITLSPFDTTPHKPKKQKQHKMPDLALAKPGFAFGFRYPKITLLRAIPTVTL